MAHGFEPSCGVADDLTQVNADFDWAFEILAIGKEWLCPEGLSVLLGSGTSYLPCISTTIVWTLRILSCLQLSIVIGLWLAREMLLIGARNSSKQLRATPIGFRNGTKPGSDHDGHMESEGRRRRPYLDPGC